MTNKDKLVEALLKNEQSNTVASFDSFTLPIIRKSWGGEKEVEVIEQIGTEVEELPAAGPGEVQVGDGDGPQETPVFQTTKKAVSYAESIMDDLISVQPIQPNALNGFFSK